MDQLDLMVTVPGMGLVLVLEKEKQEELVVLVVLVVLEGWGVLARLVGLDQNPTVHGMGLGDAKERNRKIEGNRRAKVQTRNLTNLQQLLKKAKIYLLQE